MDDATPNCDLVARAREGDREAFAQLYESAVSVAWRVAWLSTSNRSAAEEIVGDAMLALVDSLPTLPDSQPRLLAWLRTVVRNKSVDWVRRQSRRRTSADDVARNQQQRRPDIETSDTLLCRGETQDQVRAALELLDETDRTALTMRYVSELSCGEIAETLGLSGAAANSLLYRARIRFRDAIKSLVGDDVEEWAALTAVAPGGSSND